MPTFAELVDADPTAWLHQARAWDELARDLSARADEIRDAYAGLDGIWEGADARAARDRRDRLVAELGRAAGNASEAAVVLGRHAGTVMAAQQRVHAAVRSANPLVSRVTADGTVLPALWVVASAPGAATTLALYLADARRISAEIAAALADAERSDAEAVAALHRLAPGGPEPTAPDGGGAGPDGIPPEGTEPAEVRAWWRGLPPGGRERLLAEHPDRVGELDGVPAVDRDRANRLRLDEARIRLRRAAMRVSGDERDRLDDMLVGIGALERRLARPGALLLGFGTSGGGHAVVATRDPDHSDHVVTSVPGLGARLGTVGTDLARSDAIADAARTADPRAGTASITWIGYRAPAGLLSAAGDGRARDGGAALARFQDGLRAGGAAHLTVVGHSYGSLVAGRAAADDDLQADDLVLVGSPGVGGRDVADLRMDPRHVWATVAANDPVNHVPGPWVVSTSNPFRPGHQLAHGTDPTDPVFGARVFASAPGTLGPGPDDPGTPEDESTPTAAHGQYWAPGSPSLGAIGRIAVGRDDADR